MLLKGVRDRLQYCDRTDVRVNVDASGCKCGEEKRRLKLKGRYAFDLEEGANPVNRLNLPLLPFDRALN